MMNYDIKNIPPVDFNIENLRKYSILGALIGVTALPNNEHSMRAWFLNTIHSVCRNYHEARSLAVQQVCSDELDKDKYFYVFDIPLFLENAVTGAYRACKALDQLAKKKELESEFIEQISLLAASFGEKNTDSIQKLSQMRNQFDHMYAQIVNSQQGKGPVCICFDDTGANIIFRKVKIETRVFLELIEHIFLLVGSMFKGFDPRESHHSLGHPIRMTITAEVIVNGKKVG